MTRRNYRVDAYFGISVNALVRITSVLDTGAGSSFIRKSLIPDSMHHRIQPYLERSNIKDANNRRVNSDGIISFETRLVPELSWFGLMPTNVWERTSFSVVII